MENKQELPAGWKWVKLGEVCEYSSGIWGDEPDNSENCYFVLRSNNIKDGKMIFTDLALRKVDAKYVESKSLKNGDILVTTSSGSKDLLGKSAIFIPPDDRTYLFSNFTMRLRANPLLADSFYVFLYLQSPEAKKILQLLQDTTTGLRNLDRREFMNQLIPLPPLSEQKRIAEKLKAMMDEIDEAKASIEKQLEAAKTLPSTYLREVFESPEAQKWEKKKLGEVCEIAKGKKPILYDENISDKALPYLTAEVIRYNLKPKWCLESNGDVVKVSKDEIVIIADGSNSGEVFIGFEGALASTMGKLKIINENVSTDFLYLFIKKNFKELNVPKRGSAIPHLEKDIFYNLSIPLPPLSEQKRIAAYLKEKIDQAEKLQETLEKELETLNTLPQSILSKAFRGEI